MNTWGIICLILWAMIVVAAVAARAIKDIRMSKWQDGRIAELESQLRTKQAELTASEREIKDTLSKPPWGSI